MDMRMHEVVLDGTCGQSGSEIHVKESKQCISFCCLLLIHIQQGGGTKSLGAVAYHRPTTPSPDGMV